LLARFDSHLRPRLCARTTTRQQTRDAIARTHARRDRGKRLNPLDVAHFYETSEMPSPDLWERGDLSKY
jgi:hypothetical protein